MGRQPRREVRVERPEARLDGPERGGIADRGVDLGPVADDARVGHEPGPVGRPERRDERRVEAPERRPERVALVEDGRPRQARLERLEGQPFEQLEVVVDGRPPLVVVVGDHPPVGPRAVGAGPRAARPRIDRVERSGGSAR